MGNYHSLTNTSFAQWQSLINDCMCYTAMRAKRWQNVFLVTFISADGFNACLSVSLSLVYESNYPRSVVIRWRSVKVTLLSFFRLSRSVGSLQDVQGHMQTTTKQAVQWETYLD